MTDYHEVIDRARRLQEFEVQVAVPKGFRFTGRSPYHMKISGGLASITILALSIEEATDFAHEFFRNTP